MTVTAIGQESTDDEMTMPLSAEPASHDAHEGVMPMAGNNSDQERRRYSERRVNQAGILELLDQTDIKHDEAHKRLRLELRELEQRIEDGLKLLADRQHAFNDRLTEVAATPVDVSKLVLTPKILVSVVVMVLTIFGGMWAQSASMRSDLRDILTRMDAEKRVSDVNAKLIETNSLVISRGLEANSRELKDSIAAVNKRQELLTLQYNQLSEQITRLTAQRGR